MRSLPTLAPASDPTAPDVPAGCRARAAAALSRRGFVSAAAWSALAGALASACGGGEDVAGVKGPKATGVTFASGVVSIPLSGVPWLGKSGGFLITNGGSNDVRDAGGRRPEVIVINVGTDQYRAFTSICTHEQCTVGDYTGTRIRCFCHGSEYDTTGHVLMGPAARALTEFPVMFDAESRVVKVMRG